MGLVDDFISFLSSVILGGKHASAVFLEALDKAERYTRWGEQRGDIRDYETAVEALELCEDENAPSFEMRLRKYRLFANAVTGAVKSMANKLRQETSKIQREKKLMEEESRKTSSMVVSEEARIRQLEADKSFVSAKEAERRLKELKARMSMLDDKLKNGGLDHSIDSRFEEIHLTAEQLCARLESALAAVVCEDADEAAQFDKLREDVFHRLDRARQAVEALQPKGYASATDEAVAEAAETTDAPPAGDAPCAPKEAGAAGAAASPSEDAKPA